MKSMRNEFYEWRKGVKAWGCQSKHGVLLFEVYMEHLGHGEQCAKDNLKIIRKRDPEAKWRLALLDIQVVQTFPKRKKTKTPTDLNTRTTSDTIEKP